MLTSDELDDNCLREICQQFFKLAKLETQGVRGCPTEYFAILEPQNPPIDDSELHRIRVKRISRL